jgi:hypothetical protein
MKGRDNVSGQRHMKSNQRQGGEVCVWRALRVGGARWGVLRGGGTTPTGELLNKHTHGAKNSLTIFGQGMFFGVESRGNHKSPVSF